MSEVPPLLFRKMLGGLRPANPSAEKALAAEFAKASPKAAEIKAVKAER